MITDKSFSHSIFCSLFVYIYCLFCLLCFRYDDLIVGAPYYFEKGKEIGGAIYIYYGGKKMVCLALLFCH